MTAEPLFPPPAFAAFTAVFESQPDEEDWQNTVTVEATECYSSPVAHQDADDEDAADQGDVRHVVRVDTNYKPGRPGQHPVMLSRVDSIAVATALVTATEDTFHMARCGRLRPAEAGELLESLTELDYALTELRAHALNDLLHKREEETTPTPAPAIEPGDRVETLVPGTVLAVNAHGGPNLHIELDRDVVAACDDDTVTTFEAPERVRRLEQDDTSTRT